MEDTVRRDSDKIARPDVRGVPDRIPALEGRARRPNDHVTGTVHWTQETLTLESSRPWGRGRHHMTEFRRGVWYGVIAYVVWGLSPLFWNLVDGVGTPDLLIHRILWAIPILAVAITVQKQWSIVARSYRNRRTLAVTAVAAVLLLTNWGVFLWAVTNGQVVEASLGYFINPLVSVALGVVFLGERLRPLQWWAVGIAATGVLGLAFRVGSVPWVSLVLAFSFGVYGLLKKRADTPAPLVSLFGEICVVVVPVIAVLAFIRDAETVAFGDSVGVSAFLIAAGVITVVPLVLFGAAAKRIPLSMVGLLQYIAPTLQFTVGVVVLDEVLTPAKLLGFAFVWAALALYTYDNVRSSRPMVAPAI